MSWSISLMGKPKNVVAALKAESAKLTGASKEEYDEALPHLIGLVEQNVAEENYPQVVDLDASGHANFVVVDGQRKKTFASCSVTIKSFTKRLVMALLMLGLLLPSMALAEIIVIKIDDSKDGDYLVSVKDGVVTANPIKRVITLGPNSQPEDPLPPNVPFEKAIQDLTKTTLDNGGSKTTGAGIAAVYSLVSSGVSDGSITTDKWVSAVNAGTNAILAAQGDAAKWKSFRDDLSKVLTALSNQGLLDSKAEISGVLKNVANGMNAATGFTGNPAETVRLDPDKAGILDGIDLAKLIELIKMIIEILKLLK